MGYAPPARPAPSPVGGGDKVTTVFVGSISGGVTNEFLTSLFAVGDFIKPYAHGRMNCILPFAL